MEHSPDLSLSCDLNSLLGFLRGNVLSFSLDYGVYGWFSDLTYQHYADLDVGF